MAGLGVSVSQDFGGQQPLDALRLFMFDLQAAAQKALELVREADSAGVTTHEVNTARLQGLGDNLTALQSWVIEVRSPFSAPSVAEEQLLARLKVLHSQAEQVIAEPEGLALSKYFERSTNIFDLLVDQPSVNNIKFLLETLRVALEDLPLSIPRAGPKRSAASTTETRPKSIMITIFVAAGEASLSLAGELALKLSERTVDSKTIKVRQSWDALPNLSQYPLGGVTPVINSCQYGVLVLAPEETTADLNSTDSGHSSTGHLRLPADVEFLLGLMVGCFTMRKTFLVVPAKDEKKPELARLLTGLEPATYDPDDADNDDVMGLACTRIIKSIENVERA